MQLLGRLRSVQSQPGQHTETLSLKKRKKQKKKKKKKENRVWCCIPVISALRRLRQEDCEFKTSFGYTARLWHKNEKERERDRDRDRETEQREREKVKEKEKE
jgi:hypothetical protein